MLLSYDANVTKCYTNNIETMYYQKVWWPSVDQMKEPEYVLITNVFPNDFEWWLFYFGEMQAFFDYFDYFDSRLLMST